MWVVYDTDTGVEVSREPSAFEASLLTTRLNVAADYDHYAYRREQ